MMTSSGPKVLEYNCRFGDPETQVVLPLYGGEFLRLLEASADGTMDKLPDVGKEHGAAVAVVLASGGYPGSYEKGKMIRGLDTAGDDHTIIFHAGTKTHEGVVVTSGGRVLNVVGLGESLEKALETAYRGVGKISFDGVYYRKDIAYRALNR
jgi:phosphoribosylamine--glycine ligase